MNYIVGTKDFYIDEPTVVSIGKFDGLHRGHMKLIGELKSCAQNAYATAVFTFSTPPATLVEGCRQDMIMTNEERSKLLESAGIDYLVEYPFDVETCHTEPEAFIRDVIVGRMNAKVIITGPDCRFGYKAAGDSKLLDGLAGRYGYRYFIVDKLKDGDREISSTYIREMLSAGNIKKVNDLLGYRYFITGEVTHGSAIGMTKLYPTVNINPDKNKLLPRYGVYLTLAEIGGKSYKGLTNVGKRPTVGDDNPPNVETFLYDTDENLYGKHIRVEFFDFIRPEMKFADLDELKAQLDRDLMAGRDLLRDNAL